MATSLDLSRTYTSYSGVDIRVIINGAPAGSMQALSYAIQREKAPIYVMGSVDPVSYSRGKRGIAGTMISLMMDTHFLMSESFKDERYLADKNEVFASIRRDSGLTDARGDGATDNPGVTLNTRGGDAFTGAPENVDPSNSGAGFRLNTPATRYSLENLGQNYEVAPVYYVDQILPFDIAIIAANEYGQSAQMRLYGCEILNEGSGFSIDDIVIENQMTYVCRTILPWRSFDMTNVQGGGSGKVRETLYSKNESARRNRRDYSPQQ
jgi:hypothetical protein